MLRPKAFRVEGAVTEILSPTRGWVRLANGHRLMAFVPGRQRAKFHGLVAGETVRLEVSPFDLSVGRILVPKTETNEA